MSLFSGNEIAQKGRKTMDSWLYYIQSDLQASYAEGEPMKAYSSACN